MSKTKVVAKKNENKLARTATNKQRRAKKHTRRMEEQVLPFKMRQGTARALRRWTDGITKDYPPILKGRYNQASLMRSKTPPKRQASLFLLRINGIECHHPMMVMAVLRDIAAAAKARKAEQAAHPA